jgi:NAD-dependent deacetylase
LPDASWNIYNMFHDLIEALCNARSLFVLTGAGISAESGLPTYRGAGGVWNRHRVEDLASPEGFERDPYTVWRWYNERIVVHRQAQPNAGHLALAELERLIPQVIVATQNVDSLHVRAGSTNVLELHGHLREARCTRCSATTSLAKGLDEDAIDHACGGRFRPKVVWFGEALPTDVWRHAAAAALAADVILVVGTSAQVYPAASLATQNDRAFVAEINPDPTPLSSRCSCTIRSGAASALPEIVAAVKQMLTVRAEREA